MGRPKKIKEEIKKIARPIQHITGMHDILPQDFQIWDFCLEKFIKLANTYNFQRIETPILEKTDLFIRSVGESTDIVEKEMFSFCDKGEENLTLRPEGTVCVARAYIEHGMYSLPQPQKFYYIGPMFRYSRPQAGRFRQFWQLSLEILGDKSPVLDAQIIFLTLKFLSKLGLSDLEIGINSIGCRNCRIQYKEMLKDYYTLKQRMLCDDCKRRLKINPLRLLDCKQKQCQVLAQGAPQIIDSLCEECHDHFKSVLEYLDEAEVPYQLDPHLVRGLDYYTKTVFEVWSKSDKEIKAQTLVGGGRYDELVELLGGRPTPSVGVALGLERIVSLLKEKNIIVKEGKPEVFLAQIGELAKKKSLKIFDELVEAGIKISESLSKDSLSVQLGLANKLGVDLTLILGQKEAADGTILIRDMESGMQEIVDLTNIIGEVKKRLQRIKEQRRK
jgi:histidyl-tRNA synthetase